MKILSVLLLASLKTISGHLKHIVSHNITQYQKSYVYYFNLYVYSSIDFSLLLGLEMYGNHLFFRPSYIESTTVLFDDICSILF